MVKVPNPISEGVVAFCRTKIDNFRRRPEKKNDPKSQDSLQSLDDLKNKDEVKNENRK